MLKSITSILLTVLAMTLIAAQTSAATVTVNVGGQNWSVSTVVGDWNSVNSSLETALVGK